MLTFLKNLFVPSVDSLTDSINKQAQRLENLAVRRLDRADAFNAYADKLNKAADRHADEADRAYSVAAKLRDLTA